MFVFKALLDAKVNNNRLSSHSKVMKKFPIASLEMVSRKKDYLNENVDKVDFMVNSRDHPIEIDDDEVSEEKEFRSGEVRRRSINSNVGFNKYGVANEFGKYGCIETKLHVDCEGGHKEKCLDEGIPSFNLGIEDDIYTPPNVNAGVALVKILENDMISLRPKRSQTFPPVLRSPFFVRAIEIDSNLTKEENIKSNWLFSLCGNPTDDLFHSINGQRGERYMFENLYPGEFLFSGTIDCFVEVLNYDERARNLDTPSCFFFKTAVLDHAYMHSEACKYDEYQNYKENVFIVWNNLKTEEI
ncbi:unnamed protein product [Lactuca saligna]|uniref:Uncharacterized protein n=1 Tax=Lactuca saligna TaxID=75948 RepID=A0AA35YBV0_LACSI|nr:unnamed protein product [Lactuca saligna]